MSRFPGNIIIALCGLIAACLASCTPEACFEDTNAFVKASLYFSETNRNVAPDSITIFGLDRDTAKLYNKAAGVKLVKLPLDASSESCSFIVKINGIIDTISFEYNSYPHLISKECGYTFYHTVSSTDFTTNIIDSLSLSKAKATTINEENIRIYY